MPFSHPCCSLKATVPAENNIFYYTFLCNYAHPWGRCVGVCHSAQLQGKVCGCLPLCAAAEGGVWVSATLHSCRGRCVGVCNSAQLQSLAHLGMFKGIVPVKNIFFVRHFYAIMHRTTIVQNKIISIISSCLFYVQIIFIILVLGRCS